MVILGLTGSIGMGKSFAAKQFILHADARVFDADKEVHDMLGKGGEALAEIEKIFPEVVVDGEVNRHHLGEIVFADTTQLNQLETILHPIVNHRCHEFIEQCKKDNHPFVVLDIPLLFESGMDALCDATAVVYAPCFIQKMRVLRRKAMTKDRFQAINRLQLTPKEKKRRADYVIYSGFTKSYTSRQIKNIVRKIKRRFSSEKGA